MRIILTKNSKDLIESLNKERSEFLSKRTSPKNSLIIKNPPNSTNENFNQSSSINNNLKNSTEFPHKIMRKTWSVDSFHTSKNIAVKQKKINLPQPFSNSKYSNDLSEINLLPEIPQGLKSKVRKSNLNSCIEHPVDDSNTVVENNGYSFFLKDVLRDSTIINLKKDVKINEQMNLTKDMINTKVRSIYKDKSKLDEINEKINNVKINSSTINLLRYINQKSSISETMVNNLAKIDVDKQTRLNKVCQKIIENNHKDEAHKSTFQEKLINQKKKIKIDSNNFFNQWKQSFDYINKLSKMYDFSQENTNKKELIREKHITTKRQFWENPFIEKLTDELKKSRKKRRSIETQSLMLNSTQSFHIFNHK